MKIDEKKYPALAEVLAAEKKIDISRIYSDIGDFYRKADPRKREEIGTLLVELAEKIGVRTRFVDNRDMYLVADENGRFVTSTSTFQAAAKIRDANPGYQYYNRTHPGCPPELKAEFDKKTGW